MAVEDPKRWRGTQRRIEYSWFAPGMEMIKELSGGVVWVDGQREQQDGPYQNEQGEPADLDPGRQSRKASSEGDDDGTSFLDESGKL